MLCLQSSIYQGKQTAYTVFILAQITKVNLQSNRIGGIYY